MNKIINFYVNYIISTQNNYTCTNLADHLENVSHDVINDYLKYAKHSSSDLWKLVSPLIDNINESYLVVDDTVLDKRYSEKIEMVKRQYSGNVHGLVNGINIVNLVHNSKENYYPIDYRIYDPSSDGKTKNDHFRDMLRIAFEERRIKANIILFDNWYASVKNLKFIHRLGKIFVTTLKENRLISLDKEQGYIHLSDINWSDEQLQYGIEVKLKELPFKVLLFKIVTPTGDIEWIVTNRNPGSVDAQVIKMDNNMRWSVEQLHRELKQLTGIERCQCRKQRAQRNHIFFCYQAWLSLKAKAREIGSTVYKVKQDLLKNYLCNELLNPRVPIYKVA